MTNDDFKDRNFKQIMADDEPLFQVLLEYTGRVVKVPVSVLTDIQQIDGGCYWEVRLGGELGYVIHSAEFEAAISI